MRLHDNPVLNYAIKKEAKHKQIVPVYSFDPRFFNRKVDKWDSLKCGLTRNRFILESVTHFRERLEKVGSHLLVTMEKPEDFIKELIETENDDVENTIVY